MPTTTNKYPNDLTISGLCLGRQDDTITYTSKKTGQQETLKREVLVLKCSFGIVVCRFFNPSVSLAEFKEGETITLPVSAYSIEQGLKTATIRI